MAKGEESKTGLIGTLIGFVLLSIVLGVVAWQGISGQEALKKSAADANTAKITAEQARDWYRFQAVQLKAYAGAPMIGSEKEALATLRGNYDSGSLKTGEPDETAGMQKLVSDWDKAYKSPKGVIEGLTDRNNRLNGELAATRQSLQGKTDELAKSNLRYNTELANKEAEFKQMEKKFKDKESELANLIKVNAQQLDERLANADKASVDFENARKKLEAVELAAARDKQNASRSISDYQGQLKKLQNQLAPPDLLKFDTPKGKIISLDPRGEMAFINLGSADGVRQSQNLTFSVFSPGAGGRVSETRKGAIEVLEVKSSHLSMAKITEVVDPNQNPIVTGDVLINPSWSPNDKEHIAIAGLIDLTGDRRDNIEELMRNLTQQGVVVDEFLDVREAKRKGLGMTIKTNYLVLGDPPEFDTLTGRENDPRRVRNEEIAKLMSDMREEATKKGITIVPLNRFITLTGYRVPRGAGVGGRGFTFESRGSGSAPKPANTDGQKQQE